MSTTPRVLDLDTYLKESEQSETSFAERANTSQSVINRARKGQGCDIVNLLKIVRASRRHPTSEGGIVGFEVMIEAQRATKHRI